MNLLFLSIHKSCFNTIIVTRVMKIHTSLNFLNLHLKDQALAGLLHLFFVSAPFLNKITLRKRCRRGPVHTLSYLPAHLSPDTVLREWLVILGRACLSGPEARAKALISPIINGVACAAMQR